MLIDSIIITLVIIFFFQYEDSDHTFIGTGRLNKSDYQ